MHTLDFLIVYAYFALIAVISLWVTRGQKTTSKYFIADRTIPAWAVAFTLMATMISSGAIVGTPGTVYERGMILLLGHLMLPLVLLFVAYFIVPFYRHVVGMSAYEFVNKRFGAFARVYASLGFLADRIFDLGVTLITTAIAVQVMTGWEMMPVIIGIGIFTIIYTTVGGIEAVVWTNAVQGAIILGGMLLVPAFLLFSPEAGPPGAVVAEAWRGGRFDLGRFDLSWDSLFDPDTTQWLFLLAFIIGWGRRYVSDQHMVQRYLIAKSDRAARQGAFWGAFLCVPIWVTFMFIGACLYGYYQLTPHEPPAIADQIAPYFIVNAMPTGLVGLILAAIMAASMSSVSADLNSVATVATTDYFSALRPLSNDKARLIFGRLMVVVFGILATLTAILLIPREGIKPLMERGVTIAAIISAGSLGLFLLGFLTRRATRLGCYSGIAACILFSAWGLLTSGGEDRILDTGVNFTMNPILIGVFGHFVLFGVGYLVSLIFGGYRPDDVEQLTIFRRKDLDLAEATPGA
ncbi:MAG TPA: sodium/solute symporter [Candidatus Sumerlaeota bacterium]|nr:MAG: Sodium/glucose cotransporter [candidate division BRC1 bacterium ADurb.BinA292]HOE96976.1 sodium/solute symporter [Candidatus Sumerlaeota bacterium]HPK03824.1 sodium/solute symporter [Candidatus Sumerlaeota bacterium]